MRGAPPARAAAALPPRPPVARESGPGRAPPAQAPLEANARERAQDRGLLVRAEEGDRRDRAPIEVASWNVEEEIPDGADFEFGQAPGHLGPDAAQVADGIAERSHWIDARGHPATVSNGLPAEDRPATLGRSHDPGEGSWLGPSTSAPRATYTGRT